MHRITEQIYVVSNSQIDSNSCQSYEKDFVRSINWMPQLMWIHWTQIYKGHTKSSLHICCRYFHGRVENLSIQKLQCATVLCMWDLDIFGLWSHSINAFQNIYDDTKHQPFKNHPQGHWMACITAVNQISPLSYLQRSHYITVYQISQNPPPQRGCSDYYPHFIYNPGSQRLLSQVSQRVVTHNWLGQPNWSLCLRLARLGLCEQQSHPIAQQKAIVLVQ